MARTFFYKLLKGRKNINRKLLEEHYKHEKVKLIIYRRKHLYRFKKF